MSADLRISGLEKSFGAVRALAGVDLTVDAGRTIGLLGPNGSGKTTLVNCVSGVLPITAGTIRMGATDISTASPVRRARAGLVRTFQNLRLFTDLTVLENIECALAPRSGKAGRSREVLAAILDEHELADRAHARVRDLPYGLQKRTEIARALAAEPRLLLLDEPAAGLSDSEAQLLGTVIRRARERLGFTLLLIDHNVAFVAALADELVVLAEGRVIRRGLPADILADPEVARIYLGASFAPH